jgi:protein-disulfide isomerase
MDKIKWIIFVVVVAAIFGGVIWVGKNNDKPFEGDAAKIITEGPIADRVYGSQDQKVVLIEYGDYQCPGCRAMAAPVKTFAEQYKDKLTFIFRHMPLTNSHPNALAAAATAEAAGQQGKYWEMHDKLYENQDAWSGVPVDQRGAVFEGYASELGLNIEQYKKDITSKDITNKIGRDKSTATQKFGVDSTPTFVLNGQVIKGQDAVKADVLATKIEEALKAAYGEKAVNTKQTARPKQ